MDSQTMMPRWGTWEELLLGGAVLRHGAAAWPAVAAELRSRTCFPNPFSPEECKSKFAEVQKRYSGCDTWFEELRKQRVAELRKELEKSENSIGSLQSKLASLSSSSPSPTENSGHNLVFSKNISLSKSCSQPPCGIFDSDSGSGSGSVNLEGERENSERWHWGFQKKRGRREGRREKNGDTDTSSSHIERQGSSESGTSSLEGESVKLDLGEILKTLVDHKQCSIFQRRLESQKKAQYKKIIRRHMDLQIISSKLSNGIISSKELLRDLLLVVNNTLVYYPNNSIEHDSAITLRKLAHKLLHKNFNSYRAVESKKPEIVQPCSQQTGKAETSGATGGTEISENKKQGSCVETSTASRPTDKRDEISMKKRGIGRPVKRGGQRRKEELKDGDANKGKKSVKI